MKKLLLCFGVFVLAGNASANFDLMRYGELIKTKPHIQGKNVRIWNIRQDKTIRINLVEFTGELALHKHPDADHSLIVLEGSVKVLAGDKTITLNKGDFISVHANVPHKYWTIGPKAMLVSMDAPYYDPKNTVPLEEL